MTSSLECKELDRRMAHIVEKQFQSVATDTAIGAKLTNGKSSRSSLLKSRVPVFTWSNLGSNVY